MKLRKWITPTDVATGIGLALVVGSSLMSMKMAFARDFVTVGTFEEGKAVGTRNGGILADRLYTRVIGTEGCAGLGDFQWALRRVLHSVRAPSFEGGKFVAGFYSGYVGALRDSIHKAREACEEAEYTDGAFPGQLFGEVVCSVAAQSPEAFADIAFGPIYDGWSTNKSVSSQCAAAFTTTVSGCDTTGIAAQLLNAAASASCAL